MNATKKAAATATEARKTSLDLDADTIAKLRAMLRALGSRKTAEAVIDGWLRDTILSEPFMGYIQETVHGMDGWAKHPRKKEINAKLKRIAEGDRRLIRNEPLARNTVIFSETFPRLVATAREKSTTPNTLATSLVRRGLDQLESGEISFSITNTGGAR